MSKIAADFGGRRQHPRAVEVEVVEVDDGGVRGIAGVLDEAERMAGRPELRIVRNPVLDDLPDQRVLEPRVQMHVELVDEVDRACEVLAAGEQVEKNVEHLLLAAAEQVVVDLGRSLSETDVRRAIFQRRAYPRQLQPCRRGTGEDPRERVVERVDELRLEPVRIELRSPDLVMDASRHFRDVGLEPRVLIDVASRAVPVGADGAGGPAPAAQFGNRS